MCNLRASEHVEIVAGKQTSEQAVNRNVGDDLAATWPRGRVPRLSASGQLLIGLIYWLLSLLQALTLTSGVNHLDLPPIHSI